MESRKEIEAKFNVSNLDEIRRRLADQGGHVVVPKRWECNLYFDTHDRRLQSGRQVLRIRTGAENRMTYKRQDASFEDRTEIEMTLDDASEAQAMLQALGFELILTYNKVRETYALNGLLVLLDELLFGQFVEIEGPALDEIRAASVSLGLDWQKRSKVGYLSLFERVREQLDLPTHDASFKIISKHPALRSEDLGLVDATVTENHDGTAS